MANFQLVAQPATPVPIPPPASPESIVTPVTVHNITSTTGGLSQPWATVIAAVIALVAASLAFAGVWYSQRIAVKTTKAQLRHQRSALLRQEKQIHRELQANQQMKLHSAGLAALTEAATALSALRGSSMTYARNKNSINTAITTKVSAELTQAGKAANNARARLIVLGLKESAAAFTETTKEFKKIREIDPGTDNESFSKVLSLTLLSLNRAYETFAAELRGTLEASSPITEKQTQEALTGQDLSDFVAAETAETNAVVSEDSQRK